MAGCRKIIHKYYKPFYIRKPADFGIPNAIPYRYQGTKNNRNHGPTYT